MALLTIIGDDAKGKPGPGNGPGGNGNAQRKPNAANGEGSTADSASQPLNPAALAEAVRLATYPNGAGPVDVLGALSGRGYIIAEVDLGALAGVLIRQGGAAVVALSTGVSKSEQNWAAAVLLYKVLVGRGEGAEIEGLPEGTLQNDAYQADAETFAAELLLPAADVNKVWAREATAGRDSYQAVKVIAGVFAIPEDRARARAVDLGLITER